MKLGNTHLKLRYQKCLCYQKCLQLIDSMSRKDFSTVYLYDLMFLLGIHPTFPVKIASGRLGSCKVAMDAFLLVAVNILQFF